MKAYTAYTVAMYFQGGSKSAYPMHSGEQYRIIWSSGFFLELHKM